MSAILLRTWLFIENIDYLLKIFSFCSKFQMAQLSHLEFEQNENIFFQDSAF